VVDLAAVGAVDVGGEPVGAVVGEVDGLVDGVVDGVVGDHRYDWPEDLLAGYPRMSLVTSAKTVGRTNHPSSRPSGLPGPPAIKVAPSSSQR
jgi:hypothetical protein